MYRFSRSILSNPFHKVAHLFCGRKEGGEANDPSAVCIAATQKSLDQSFIANFTLIGSEHVSLVENYEPHIVDNVVVIAQRKVELLWRGNNNRPTPEGIGVRSEVPCRAIQRRNRNAKGCESIRQFTLDLR